VVPMRKAQVSSAASRGETPFLSWPRREAARYTRSSFSESSARRSAWRFMSPSKPPTYSHLKVRMRKVSRVAASSRMASITARR
jgi:hypothetical protein